MKSLMEEPEDATPTLEIDARAGQYKRFRLEVPLDEVLLYGYQMPEAQNLQSADSYIHTESRLWMFQSTRSFDHKEDLDGIVKLLQFLKVLHKVKDDPSLQNSFSSFHPE
mmetsp:Transcript_19064/g.31617  ORF Transcript_19064/g.31617 Transcript_19064/m.31617 type:complete len:110 (+) Transcript_19064:413-742(+)